MNSCTSTTIINHNQHDMNIAKKDDVTGNVTVTHTFDKAGQPITLTQEKYEAGKLNGIPVYHTKFLQPSLTLLEEKAGTFHLVNLLVGQWFATYFPARKDIIGPDSSKMFYNSERKPIGVSGFVRYTDQIKLLDRKDLLGERDNIEFINLSGQSVTVAQGNTTKPVDELKDTEHFKIIKTIAPTETNIKVELEPAEISEINHIPITTAKYKPVENWPEQNPNKIYIVSMLVGQMAASRFPERTDFVVPNYGPRYNFRTSKGQPIATTSFERY